MAVEIPKFLLGLDISEALILPFKNFNILAPEPAKTSGKYIYMYIKSKYNVGQSSSTFPRLASISHF